MALKSIKDVAKMLDRFKTDQERFLVDTSSNILTMLAGRNNMTKDEMIEEIKTDVETLGEAIAILEKESDQ